jgi:23S rRNA (cytidine2498-2'-O)-methyltransferase
MAPTVVTSNFAPIKMPDSPAFVFITCQVGAEPAVKREVSREWPRLRFAFSRPGFLTFKIAPERKLPDDFGAKLVFARAAGFCLGKATGATPQERADLVWKLIGNRPVTQLHVWPRDRYTPGFHDYEPGMTVDVAEAERVIRERAPRDVARHLEISDFQFSNSNFQSRQAAAAEDRRQTIPRAPPCPPFPGRGEDEWPLVADVVTVDDAEWWVGYHRVHSLASSWPGGFCEAALPAGAVSRAWLKMYEALLWSGFAVKAGERCVEIGSAPGGASQCLLAQGLDVVGIDPAEMDRAVLADPHFRHIRKRSKEVPRSEFVGIDWLTCDVNLPPNYTLDTVKAIVTQPGVKLKGMLLMLKLVDWSLAQEIPEYLECLRFRGFRHIRARQLHYNRQEICVAASGFGSAGDIPDRTRKSKRPSSARPGASVRMKRPPRGPGTRKA